MTRFTFSLSESQKERWEDYLENTTQHDTLAELIRFSVEQQVESPDTSEETENARRRHNELMGKLDDIASGVDNNEGLLDLVLTRQLDSDDVAELLEMYLREEDDDVEEEDDE